MYEQNKVSLQSVPLAVDAALNALEGEYCLLIRENMCMRTINKHLLKPFKALGASGHSKTPGEGENKGQDCLLDAVNVRARATLCNGPSNLGPARTRAFT